MLAMFLSALDQTIVATALATIGRAYANVENLAWIITAYLLAATAVTPLYGKLADIRGRRPVLLTGIAIFILGSVACALSPNMPTLIAARALQGVGGGGLIALSQTIMRNRVVAHAIGAAALAYGTMIALTIYTPVYFETVLGLSASAAGLMLIPFMGGTVIGSTFGGRLMSKVAHYKRIATIGTPFAA